MKTISAKKCIIGKEYLLIGGNHFDYENGRYHNNILITYKGYEEVVGNWIGNKIEKRKNHIFISKDGSIFNCKTVFVKE
jgi:hypothetical protein